jgi:hypothetical protein
MFLSHQCFTAVERYFAAKMLILGHVDKQNSLVVAYIMHPVPLISWSSGGSRLPGLASNHDPPDLHLLSS